MKKFVYGIVSIIWMWIWFVSAQSISLVPQWGSIFWNGCTVPIDVYINTNWQEISAIDLVMESSMDYVDFVPSDYVPYYLKPVVKKNGLIHIVWFTVDPSERIKWEWKMWTVYFSQRQWDIDWVVRLYFLWEWETIDSNLSIAWWVDVLKDAWEASIKFSNDLQSCMVESNNGSFEKDIQVENKIDWWFADLTYDEVLENTINIIDKKHWSTLVFWQFLRHNIVWMILLFILFIIILLLLKKEKNKWNKNVVKQ